MEVSGYLLSGVLTGLFLLGTVVILARNQNWRTYSPTRNDPNVGERIERVAASPTTWIVVFLLLALGLGFGAMVLVGGISVPAWVQTVAGAVMLAAVLAVLGGFVFLGVYQSIRYRGLYRSQAAAAGIWVVGLLAIAGIAAMLITTG